MDIHHRHFRRHFRFFLLVSDLAFWVGSFLVLFQWRLGASGEMFLGNPVFWFFFGLLFMLLYVFGAYEVERFNRGLDGYLRVGFAVIVMGIFGTLFVYVGGDVRAGLFGRGVWSGGLFGFFMLTGTSRWALFRFWRHRQRRMTWFFAVSEAWVDRLKKDLKAHHFGGQCRFLTEQELCEVPSCLEGFHAGLVVGLDRSVFEQHHELSLRIFNARVSGHNVLDLTAFYEHFWQKIPVQVLATEWFVQAEGFSLFRMPIQQKLKRLFDLLVGTALFLVVWPVMLLAAVCVRLESSGPAFYRQVRTGFGGRPFVIYKFRSMRMDAEEEGVQWAVIKDPRVTRIGGFLRKSRIDELPQIFNVLKGDMSLIGPRPERPEFNERLRLEIPLYELRHLVRPGITGWAQIMYPYGASVEDAWEKLQYDLFYIKNQSFWLDVRIALKTARVMMLGQGQ